MSGEWPNNPRPVSVEVCTRCGLPWSDHINLAWAYDQHTEVSVPRPITLDDCIALLKRANQGPPGPPGPMGMTGAPGPAGISQQRQEQPDERGKFSD